MSLGTQYKPKPLITLSMQDRYFVNDQELAVNDSLHLELSEDKVDPTLSPPGVTEETLIIDETIIFEECKDIDDEEDTCDELDEDMIFEDGILDDSFLDPEWNDPEASKISSTSSPT